MKRFLFIVVSVLLLFGTLVACQKESPTYNDTSVKEDIFTENEELSPEVTSALSFYKEFLGGTGYKVISENEAYYEYEGGVMSIDFAINNMAYGFECGLFLVLNGVFQEFSLTNSTGETTEMDYMHKIDVPEKQKVVLRLNFTPNTGGTGDKLNLAVGTMQEPSYTSVYSGWPQYSKYGYHSYSAASAMTVKMNSDSTKSEPAKNIKISQIEISDSYFDYLTASVEEDRNRTWRNNHAFALYYDTYDFDRDLIILPDANMANIKLDVLGKTATYRISLFINNELVKFENDKTYFEIHNTDDKIVHIEIPIDISNIPDNSHIYVIASEKDDDETSLTYGTFIYAGKTRTCYLIKGELQEPSEQTLDTIKTTEDKKLDVTSSLSQGEMKLLKGYELLYVSSIDNKTVCFVGRDSSMVKKAIYYDIGTDSIINTIDLGVDAKYFSVTNGNLISVDSTRTTDGKCKIVDREGKVINTFAYTDNISVATENKGVFALMSDAQKRVAVNSQTGDIIYVAGSPEIATTYYIPISTETKIKLEFFSDDKLPTQIRNFSGNNILTLNVNDDESTLILTDISGKKMKEIELIGKKDLTCAGKYAVIFEQKNQSGISSNNIAEILDCITGEMKEVVFETNSENQWCTLSLDSKYVLTLDNTSTFRLYLVEDSSLIKSFQIEDLDFGITEAKVFIDSINRRIYLQTIKEDVYGVYVENF